MDRLGLGNVSVGFVFGPRFGEGSEADLLIACSYEIVWKHRPTYGPLNDPVVSLSPMPNTISTSIRGRILDHHDHIRY